MGSWSGAVGAAVLALSGFLVGCGGSVDEVTPEADPRQGALTDCNLRVYESCRTVTLSAANGAHLVFKYYACPATDPSDRPGQYCPVEADFYGIGGGGTVLAADATLTLNVADVHLGGGWAVESAGLFGPTSHSVKGHAIGLKLYDPSNHLVDLSNDIHMYSKTSAVGDPFTVYVSVAPGELLIGGGWGASVAQPAVDAYAHGMLGGQWQVNGKQFASGPGSINGVAIGLSRCLPAANPIVCFGHRDIIQSTSPDGTSVESAVASNYRSSSVAVGVGAISSSWARPIWSMFTMGSDFDPNSGSRYGAGVALTSAPTGASGHVTTQVMTLGI
jgi:hypothetical protein